MSIGGYSQTPEHIENDVQLGWNIGALAPASLPANIRKVKSYVPLFGLSAGYRVIFPLSHKWGIAAGLNVDFKGMRVKDSVIYMHTLISVQNGTQQSTFEGDFSGTNETEVRNVYLTVPITAVFRPGKTWRYHLGVYGAVLVHAGFSGNVSNGYIRNGNSLGEKVEITKATFDFKRAERHFDCGISAGAERSFGARWGARASLSWGLRPVFPSSFKGVSFGMYNIFATLGASYRLFH